MADKIKHPKKKKRPVKKPPSIQVYQQIVTRESWESWLTNQIRRESVILKKASVKTAATKDELENLLRKDAFLIAAAKALGVWSTDHEEFVCREGYEQYFVPPECKESNLKIWDEKNTPQKNPLDNRFSIWVYVLNEANAEYIAHFEYETGLWKNREGKLCNQILNWHIYPTKKTEE